MRVSIGFWPFEIQKLSVSLADGLMIRPIDQDPSIVEPDEKTDSSEWTREAFI